MYQPNLEVIADSIFYGERLTTLVVWNFPKTLLQEVNTHRSNIARNAASSRAIPTKKVIENVLNNPYIPIWSENQRGMSGGFITDPQTIYNLNLEWLEARDKAVEKAQRLSETGVHKQDVNRLLEPFMMVPWIVTSNNWTNFFNLRCSPHAYPAFQKIAVGIRDKLAESTPNSLKKGEFHVPFYKTSISDCNGIEFDSLTLLEQIQICIARIARISYNSFTGKIDFANDLRLYQDLLREGHLSPFEHVCKAHGINASDWYFRETEYQPYQYGSFWDMRTMEGNWLQFRHLLIV